jgi:hypothetical protein
VRGYLSIVPGALRGSTRLYVRRESDDRVDSSLSGAGVQGTGRGTVLNFASSLFEDSSAMPNLTQLSRNPKLALSPTAIAATAGNSA